MKRFISLAGIVFITLFITGCPGDEDSTGGSDRADSGAAALFDDLPLGEELDEKQLAVLQEGGSGLLPEEEDGLPVFEPASSGGDSGAGTGGYEHRDQFDSLDFDFWTAIEEKTNRVANEKLRLEDGSLVIEAAVTDRNPFVHSRSIPLPENGTVRVKRRVKIHRDNEYFNGTFSLYQSSTEGIKKPENDGGREETKKIAAIQFLDFQYDIGRYPIAKGVLITAPEYRETGEFAVFNDAPFDRWVEEEIEYHPATGKIVYRLGNESRTVMGDPAELPYFRIQMNAYGWYTGHRADVDYIEIRVTGGSGGADALPEGFSAEDPVITELYTPSAEEQTFTAPEGVGVTLPGFAAEDERRLAVEPLEITGSAGSAAAGAAGESSGNPPKLLKAYNISLGNVHRFDSFVRVEMPLPDLSGLPGDKPEDKVIAVSYDSVTGAWYQEPAEFEDGKIAILTKHLSVAGVRSRGDAPSSSLVDLPGSLPADDRQKAMDAAWSAFMNDLGWTSAAGNFTALVTDFPFLKEINTDLGNFGNAMAVLDVAKKMVDGKTAEANISALKSVQGWLMGKLATTGMQIASLGVFFIDYSLNKFATVALGREFAAYEDAYKKYYIKYGKTPTEWYNDFKKILADSGSQEEARKEINRLIDSYVNKIWTTGEYDRLLKFVNEAKGTSVGQISLSLTNEVEQKLSNNHKALLAQSLQPIFLTLKRKLLSDAEEYQHVHQRAMEKFLKRKTVVFVDVAGLRQGEKAETALFTEGKPIVKGRPASDRADFYMALPVWKLVRYGGPDELKIRVHLREGDKTVTKVFSKSFKADKPVKKVSFNLEDVYTRPDAGKAADSGTGGSGEAAEQDGGQAGEDGSDAEPDDTGSADFVREGIWDGYFLIHEAFPETERKLLKSVNEARGTEWEGDISVYVNKKESIGYTLVRDEQGELVIQNEDKENYDLKAEGRNFTLIIWAFGKSDRHKTRMVFDGTLQNDGETIEGEFLVDCIFGEVGRGEFLLEWSPVPVFDDDDGEGDSDELMF